MQLGAINSGCLPVGLVLVMVSTPILAKSQSMKNTDPMAAALIELEAVDGGGRWFSYSVAIFGAAVGLSIGGWALHVNPLSSQGKPDAIVFGSALLVIGSAGGQIVHGGMRYDERGTSAKHARALLDDTEARKVGGALFLQDRVAEAHSTRFWGAVITSAQGLGLGALGTRLWAHSRGRLKTTGAVLSVMGIATTGIGAVHFFGDTRSAKILKSVDASRSSVRGMRILPTALVNPKRTTFFGLAIQQGF